MSDPAELAIRLSRAAFNRALSEANLSAIGALLAPSTILVTGTDSAVLTGRKAQLVAWKREFASKQIDYVRTPETIVVSAIEPIALEHGHWQAIAADTAAVSASGIYTAKWRRAAADWRIEAEIYLTLG